MFYRLQLQKVVTEWTPLCHGVSKWQCIRMDTVSVGSLSADLDILQSKQRLLVFSVLKMLVWGGLTSLASISPKASALATTLVARHLWHLYTGATIEAGCSAAVVVGAALQRVLALPSCGVAILRLAAKRTSAGAVIDAASMLCLVQLTSSAVCFVIVVCLRLLENACASELNKNMWTNR